MKRTIGDNTFAVSNEDGNTVYTTLTPCLMLSVTGDLTTPDPPDAQIDTILNGLVITGPDVLVNIPDGWTSLGVGETRSTYSISFEVPIATQTRRAELRQMLDANLGTLLSQAASASVTPVDFDGINAWIIHEVDSRVEFNYLAWQGEHGAVMLGLQGGTEAELIDLARTLESGHAQDWSEATGRVTSVTIDTIAAADRSQSDECPAKALAVNR